MVCSPFWSYMHSSFVPAARYDFNKHMDSKAWRCYPASALSNDTSHYVHNSSRTQDHICTLSATRLQTLLQMLNSCEGNPTPVPPPAPSGNISISTVFKAGSDGCTIYRTPSWIRAKNGTLVAFTQCRQATHGDESPQELHMKYSHDNGTTWGLATVLPFSADPSHKMQHRAQVLKNARHYILLSMPLIELIADSSADCVR
jgi:hypothetical protein